MGECPICSTRLYTQKKGIFKSGRFLGCEGCGWKMDVEEVNRRGGLDKIKATGNFNEEDINEEQDYNKDWEIIDRLPEWAFKKMKMNKTNQVNGQNYIYKKKSIFLRKKIK